MHEPTVTAVVSMVRYTSLKSDLYQGIAEGVGGKYEAYKFSSQHPGDLSNFTCRLDSLLHVCSCLNVCKYDKSEVTMAQLPLVNIVYNSRKRGSNPTSQRSIMSFHCAASH